MQKPTTSHNPRQLACEVVNAVLQEQRSLNTLLTPALQQLEVRDKGLLQELVFGLCRWHFALRAHYKTWLHKPIPKRFEIAHVVLALGVYQLHFMRIPTHAALNETVNLCEPLGILPLKGMINAVLRRSSESPGNLTTDYASSHPEWIQQKLTHNWPEHSDAIFEANNQYPPMTLRVNPKHHDRDAYLAQLVSHDIAAQACRYAQHGIQLEQPVGVEQLPAFDEGSCSVQDEAAQLCTQLLDLAPQQRVLDACAAPGGKTCAILEQETEVSLVALDSDGERSQRIHENLARLQLECEVKVALAEQLDSWWDGQLFDRILLDAPCSATGVIRRHPDIKLLRREQDIVPLASLQLKLLQELWKTLACGGKLLYATCSVFPQENSRIVERFLKLEPSASLEKIDADWGIDTGFGRQLLPQNQGSDGFFYARLHKVMAN